MDKITHLKSSCEDKWYHDHTCRAWHSNTDSREGEMTKTTAKKKSSSSILGYYKYEKKWRICQGERQELGISSSWWPTMLCSELVFILSLFSLGSQKRTGYRTSAPDNLKGIWEGTGEWENPLSKSSMLQRLKNVEHTFYREWPKGLYSVSMLFLNTHFRTPAIFWALTCTAAHHHLIHHPLK